MRERPAWVPVNWRQIVSWILTTTLVSAVSWLHGNQISQTPLPTPPAPVWEADQPVEPAAQEALTVATGGVRSSFGWQPIGERVTLDFQVKEFRDTPAYRRAARAARAARDEADPDVYLWQAATQLLGEPLPARNQNPVGSCVAFGTTCALEYLSLLQICHGRGEVYFDQVQESLYGLSRHQVGQDRIRGDGSVGAWAAEAARRYGILARGKGVEGKYDLAKYDPTRCSQWGRSGPPADLLGLIKLHPCQDYAKVRTADEARIALRQGYPIACCSGQGFGDRRDADGFARATGSWSHCMAILGYRGAPRKGFFIENSWGPGWITGPEGPGTPPKGGFWAEWSVVNRMLGQGDSYAFSDLVGFPARDLWLARLDRRRSYRSGAERLTGALLPEVRRAPRT